MRQILEFMKGYLFIVFTLILFALSSCNKDKNNTKEVDTDLTLAKDFHKIKEEAFRIFYMLEHLEQYNKVPSSAFPACASITFDTLSTNKKIIIDFGNGCKCESIDGKSRKGKLEIEWQGNYFQENGTRTIKSTSYFVSYGSNYYQFSVDMTVSTVSYLQFLSTENITLHKSTVDKITHTASYTYKWEKGKDTYNDLYDDVIHVHGNGNGKNLDNKNYTSSIAANEAIVLDTGCKWLIKGILYLNPENKNQRKIDYTTCDSYANVDIQGRIYSMNFMTLD